MIYRAFSVDSDKMISLPETGMGYQIIYGQVHGQDYARKFVVYNSEMIVELDSNFQTFKRKILNLGYKAVLNESNPINLKTGSLQLIPKSLILEKRSLSDEKKKRYRRHSGGSGAVSSPRQLANGEIYVRLSAFGDDKRIDVLNKRLRPGSFATTYEDYFDCVDTSDSPVDRYALPNDDEIKWAFYIRPKKLFDILQKGIVQPANEHDGGGIEAYFELGTSNDTYYDKRIYGQL